MSLRIPTPIRQFIEILLEIVIEDIRFMFGLDVLDREQLVAGNVENVQYCKICRSKLPITRKEGHLLIT